MTAETEAALVVNQLPGMTAARLRRLYQLAGSFQALLSPPEERLPAELDDLLVPLRRYPTEYRERARVFSAGLAEQGIAVLSLAADDYPSLLREIGGPPPLLYIKGDPNLLSLPQIAVVGSRKASMGALAEAREFAGGLAASGFVITSGMALGIDGAAHWAALKAGKTIAVLGCGVDVVYPRHHAGLYGEIIANGGAVVSEFSPGTGVRAEHFPRRNRIISGLSLGVLVVEAAQRSGSLITARLAMEQGREVFAVPGSIHNPHARGCHQLIREGAVLTETLADIVDQLGGMLAYKAEESGGACLDDAGLPGPESRVLQAMGYEPVGMDILLERTDLGAGELTALLVNLELQGYVEATGGVFTRIR